METWTLTPLGRATLKRQRYGCEKVRHITTSEARGLGWTFERVTWPGLLGPEPAGWKVRKVFPSGTVAEHVADTYGLALHWITGYEGVPA